MPVHGQLLKMKLKSDVLPPPVMQPAANHCLSSHMKGGYLVEVPLPCQHSSSHNSAGGSILSGEKTVQKKEQEKRKINFCYLVKYAPRGVEPNHTKQERCSNELANCKGGQSLSNYYRFLQPTSGTEIFQATFSGSTGKMSVLWPYNAASPPTKIGSHIKSGWSMGHSIPLQPSNEKKVTFCKS